MYGTVEVLPDEGVMFNVFYKIILCDVAGGEVLYTIDRSDTNVFNGP